MRRGTRVGQLAGALAAISAALVYFNDTPVPCTPHPNPCTAYCLWGTRLDYHSGWPRRKLVMSSSNKGLDCNIHLAAKLHVWRFYSAPNRAHLVRSIDVRRVGRSHGLLAADGFALGKIEWVRAGTPVSLAMSQAPIMQGQITAPVGC